jgi:hypothetical protein
MNRLLTLFLLACIPAWATYTAPELATPSTGTIAFPTSSTAAAVVGSSYTASVPGYIWATTELSIASPGSTADSITLQLKQVANVPATPVTYTVVAPITAVNTDTGGVIISAIKIGPQVIFAEATDTVQVYGYDSLGLTWTYRVIFSDPSWTSGMTGNTVQTGDSYALLGSTGSGLMSLASAAFGALYTQIGTPQQAGSAVTFPSAATINFTGSTMPAPSGMATSANQTTIINGQATIEGDIAALNNAPPAPTTAQSTAAFESAFGQPAHAGDAMTLTSPYDAAKNAASQSSVNALVAPDNAHILDIFNTIGVNGAGLTDVQIHGTLKLLDSLNNAPATSPPTAATIALAVWNSLTSAGYTSGSFGAELEGGVTIDPSVFIAAMEDSNPLMMAIGGAANTAVTAAHGTGLYLSSLGPGPVNVYADPKPQGYVGPNQYMGWTPLKDKTNLAHFLYGARCSIYTDANGRNCIAYQVDDAFGNLPLPFRLPANATLYYEWSLPGYTFNPPTAFTVGSGS